MNVEKLKKMNLLADTLKQHGLATTREDAANLAGDMVGSYEEQELSKVFVKPEQNITLSHNTISQDNTDEIQTTINNEKPSFSEEQIKNILQSFADQFVTEINTLTEKINSQEQIIRQFQNELGNIKSNACATNQVTQNNPQTNIVQNNNQPEQIVTNQVQTQATKPEKPKAAPRSGNYCPEDVAIDKFFYFGQK